MKDLNNLGLQPLSSDEMKNHYAGGEADDLAYNITYVALSTSPLYWMMKYNGKIIDLIFGKND